MGANIKPLFKTNRLITVCSRLLSAKLLTIEYICRMDSLILKVIQTMEMFEEKKKTAEDIASTTVNDIARNHYNGQAVAYGVALNEMRRLKVRLTLPA